MKHEGLKVETREELDSVEENRPVAVLHAASDQFESKMHGTVDVSYLVFPGPETPGSGAIIVTAREPYGMCMTKWRRKVIGVYPVFYPFTEH